MMPCELQIFTKNGLANASLRADMPKSDTGVVVLPAITAPDQKVP